ncbi:MAG: sigma-70 family RNA polymerase sigma factor [Bacteroidota bacterium]
MLRINKSITEERLINDCLKGKSVAQKQLYDRVSARMLAVCIRYIRDRQEAEHVMIGGMIKVFDKIAQYSGDGSFEGWVRRIMVNESLMYLRKNSAMTLNQDLEGAENMGAATVENVDLETEELLNMVNEMPVGYRTVFNMYAIEGYSHAEIADQLSITENTSKSQLSRARKYLQARLSEATQQEQKEIRR